MPDERRPSRPFSLRAGALAALAILAMAANARVQSSASQTSDRQPLPPDAALASLVVEPGYRVDLIAAEPLVQSPVAMAFDDTGAMYVAENRGYPDPLDGQPEARPIGTIARLTDVDGDGRYDSRTDFATGLTYPNGLMVWDGGVFVTVAPDLLYLKDTDGDGVADLRRVALTGFSTTRTAQIRFSHPTLGPDGWMYLTSGLNGGRVTAPDHPERPPVVFTSSDSRYDPRTGAFELVGGQGQYGLTFDDAGRRFICANRHPVWQVMIEPHQLARNPHLAFSESVQEVSTVGADALVWPISEDLTTASFIPSLIGAPHVGTFTSASGVHVHRGDALPAGHAGSLFIAESAQNLVQRQVREDDGVTFRSRPAREGVEFLASRDTWFRPVFLADGPDGALYVVDMYRKDIDHPAYVPEASRSQFDFTAGRERGRIYRIAARARTPRRLQVDLATADPNALVARLDDGNAWWRDATRRRLIERGSTTAAPGLRTLAAAGTALGRLHALWTLDALGVVETRDVVRALADASDDVRESALRIAERHLPSSPQLLGAVVPLTGDDVPRVRLQAALTLGAASGPAAIDALAAVARRDGRDRWVRAAVLASVRDRAAAFLDAFGRVAPIDAVTRAAVMQDLGRVLGAGESPEHCLRFVTVVADPGQELSWQPAALAGLAAGLRARGPAAGALSPLMALVAASTAEAAVARDRLAIQMARARALVHEEAAPAEVRRAAIELLGQGSWEPDGESLAMAIGPSVPATTQVAAVRALAQMRDPRAGASLVAPARWRAYTPRVRDAVLAALLSEDRLVAVLLDAVERGDVPAAGVGEAAWRRLIAHRSADEAARATRLHAGTGAASAMQAYERVRPDVLAREGSPSRGAQVFAEACAACHTMAGGGGRVGPDLSGIRNQPADALLLHIAVPDYEITPGYQSYAIETTDARTIVGRLESESPGSVTLRDASGQVQTILRSAVAAMTAAPSSLMPPGLAEALSPQQLADLIAYLKQASTRR